MTAISFFYARSNTLISQAPAYYREDLQQERDIILWLHESQNRADSRLEALRLLCSFIDVMRSMCGRVKQKQHDPVKSSEAAKNPKDARTGCCCSACRRHRLVGACYEPAVNYTDTIIDKVSIEQVAANMTHTQRISLTYPQDACLNTRLKAIRLAKEALSR